MAEQFTGKVEILDDHSKVIVTADANTASIVLGGNGKGGRLSLKNTSGKGTIEVQGSGGDHGGDFYLKDGEGRYNTIRIMGDSANIAVGSINHAGALYLLNKEGKNTILMVGESGRIELGSGGDGGELRLKNKAGKSRIYLNGESGNFYIFNEKEEGKYRTFLNGDGGLYLYNEAGEDTIALNGEWGRITLGRRGEGGELYLKNADGESTIKLFGSRGDIFLAGLNGNLCEVVETISSRIDELESIGDLESIIATLQATIASHESRISALESRISALEHQKV